MDKDKDSDRQTAACAQDPDVEYSIIDVSTYRCCAVAAGAEGCTDGALARSLHCASQKRGSRELRTQSSQRRISMQKLADAVSRTRDSVRLEMHLRLHAGDGI